MARSGSPKFQCRQFVCPPRTWTPARRCALTFDARIDTGFREMYPLTQCVVVSFSGLDTFTCVAADRLLCQGLARFVASSCAWFSSELLVRLCSCRISRLVYISFAWRTHFGHPSCIFWTVSEHTVFSFPIRPIPFSPAAGPRTATDDADSTGCFDRLPAFLSRIRGIRKAGHTFWTPFTLILDSHPKPLDCL